MNADENDCIGSPMSGADESEYPLRPCNHEEFDTRVMLHAANAVSHAYKLILGDMKKYQLTEDMAQGRKYWMTKILPGPAQGDGQES